MSIGSYTQTNNNIITKTIYGDVEYSDQDNMVIDLINKYSEKKQALETELKILKDTSVDKNLKNQAGLKIRSFLAQNASKIGEVGYKLLSTYLESKLLGK